MTPSPLFALTAEAPDTVWFGEAALVGKAAMLHMPQGRDGKRLVRIAGLGHNLLMLSGEVRRGKGRGSYAGGMRLMQTLWQEEQANSVVRSVYHTPAAAVDASRRLTSATGRERGSTWKAPGWWELKVACDAPPSLTSVPPTRPPPHHSQELYVRRQMKGWLTAELACDIANSATVNLRFAIDL